MFWVEFEPTAPVFEWAEIVRALDWAATLIGDLKLSITSPYRQDLLWGPPRGFSSGIKGQGCEADHSPPTSAEVKKTRI
jgi:hypothetical protein